MKITNDGRALVAKYELSYWSFTELDTTDMWYLYTSFGIGYIAKINSCYLMPFSLI